MHLDFKYGVGQKTQKFYRKLVVAKANEVITGGNKFYVDLTKEFNTGKVATFVEKNSDSFEFKVDSFITKKQAYLEKKANGLVPSAADPLQRSQITQELAKTSPERPELQKLANIYKYFADKTRPEQFY